jgi:hypothetical protein
MKGNKKEKGNPNYSQFYGWKYLSNTAMAKIRERELKDFYRLISKHRKQVIHNHFFCFSPLSCH